MTEKSDGGGTDEARPWQSYHTVYTNAKAGMDGVDKEKVQRVVYEMSKGSKYFENEERKEAFIKQKIEHMQEQYTKLSASDISNYQKKSSLYVSATEVAHIFKRMSSNMSSSSAECLTVDNIDVNFEVAEKRIIELEATRDMTRTWLHVDMDAFYAAVETLSNPSLEGKPMAVGSTSMISTANYEARKFGVRAAMPGFIARRLCPDLIFVPPDFEKYTHYSGLTRKVFSHYDPNFIAGSLDEAYLDITNVCKERGMSGGEIAEELRAMVNKDTGLTCSAGVAPNRMLAKVCSDINKPNDQFVLLNDRAAVMTFVSSLPIRKIGGVGKVTESILKGVLGITTCEEMLQKGGFVCVLFSHSTADFFLSVGLGLGGTDTPEIRSRKSISNERTFAATQDPALLQQKLADIAEMLSADMQKEGISGRTLTLKLKTASFEVRSRAVTLQKCISSSKDILNYASKLLKAELPVSLRLIGIRMSHFDEDEAGAAVDPKQRTLTSFLVSADASKKNVDDTCLASSDIGHLHEENASNTICSLEGDGRHYDQCGDILGNNLLPDTDANNPTSLECGFEKECRSPKEDAKLPPFSEMGELHWVDDYKCPLCDVQLPPSFVEERQEHSDFHLAERLQKEESDNVPSTSTPKQRNFPKDHSMSESRRKKQKSSPKQSRQVPIDSFFIKEP